MKHSIIFPEDCPDFKKHTKQPDGYVEWHTWAEKKEKTHVQTQCPTCKLWAIWVKKEKACKCHPQDPCDCGNRRRLK